jgi:ceramide glucosyltransferase
MLVAWTVGVWGLHDETARRKWWLLPMRDLLQFVVWVGSFFSDQIVWGDTNFRLSPSGKMTAIGKFDKKKVAESPRRAG